MLEHSIKRQKQSIMKTATFTNKQTNKTYKLVGVSTLEKAWGLAAFVCNRMSWNLDAFCEDVKVSIK